MCRVLCAHRTPMTLAGLLSPNKLHSHFRACAFFFLFWDPDNLITVPPTSFGISLSSPVDLPNTCGGELPLTRIMPMTTRWLGISLAFGLLKSSDWRGFHFLTDNWLELRGPACHSETAQHESPGPHPLQEVSNDSVDPELASPKFLDNARSWQPLAGGLHSRTADSPDRGPDFQDRSRAGIGLLKQIYLAQNSLFTKVVA